jgi:transposase
VAPGQFAGAGPVGGEQAGMPLFVGEVLLLGTAGLALAVGRPVGLLAGELRRGVGEGQVVAGLGELAAVQEPSGALAECGHPVAGRLLPGGGLGHPLLSELALVGGVGEQSAAVRWGVAEQGGDPVAFGDVTGGWQAAPMGAVVELTDEEWGLVEHLFDPPVHRGVKGTIPRRDIVDAILWLARTGCQWRHLPDRFPDWQAVWSQWRRWRDSGTWAAAMRVLAREVRLRHNRKADPTMAMIDAQTVKGGRAGPTFPEAGGRGGHTRGAKRTILIEILGLPLAVSVESAKPHDVQSARKFLKRSSTRSTRRCPSSRRS